MSHLGFSKLFLERRGGRLPEELTKPGEDDMGLALDAPESLLVGIVAWELLHGFFQRNRDLEVDKLGLFIFEVDQ